MNPENLKNSSDNIVRLIVGMSRAGTSSMVKALNLRGDVIAFGETGFWGVGENIKNKPLSSGQISKLGTIYSKVKMTTLVGVDGSVIDVTKATESLASAILSHNEPARPTEIFRAMGESMCELADRAYWVEKTPFHLMYVDKIISLYEDIRIIICLRNPKGFLLSYKHQGDRKSEQVRKNFQSLYHPAIASFICSRYYKKAVQIKEKFPSQILILHLEETIQFPEEAMRSVSKHLLLPDVGCNLYPKSNSSFIEDSSLPELTSMDLFWLRFWLKKTPYKISSPSLSTYAILKSFLMLFIWPFKNFNQLNSGPRNILLLIKRWAS